MFATSTLIHHLSKTMLQKYGCQHNTNTTQTTRQVHASMDSATEALSQLEALSQPDALMISGSEWTKMRDPSQEALMMYQKLTFLTYVMYPEWG